MSREPNPVPPRGVLRRAAGRGRFEHARHLPALPLRQLVEHYWFVAWDLRGEEPFLQETLPHPAVHWVTEQGRSAVHGIAPRRFTRLLAGRGHVFGVKFQPGGFHPYFGAPVLPLAGRQLSLEAAFGPEGAPLERCMASLDVAAGAVGAAGTAAAVAEAAPSAPLAERLAPLADAAEEFLLAHLPPPDPRLPLVQDLVRQAMEDRAITRAEQLAARGGLQLRTLQRLFARYVGARPKWVIQRYRLHEAVEQAAAGGAVDWARLALDLGYCDQAHLVRDFRAKVGQPPADFVRRAAS